MRVEPTELRDVISVTAAMAPRCRSSGVATLVDMVSGLAPAMLAVTAMVGISTLGSGETGNNVSAPSPASAMPAARSVVAMGRLMKAPTIFMVSPLLDCAGRAIRAIPGPSGQNRYR